MRLTSVFRLILLFALLSASLPAASFSIASIEGFLHIGGSTTPAASFNTSSPGFTSFLNAQNLGAFQFLWVNTTGGTVNNLTFTIFIDPDIDRDDNTFFNEYGEFLSFSLPALAPSSVIGFSAWEIDEPEYVFGNIYTHASAGLLDNSNGVPASGPVDDVSHALSFLIPSLAAGQTLIVTGILSTTDAAGLGHFDPDSNAALYFNGYAATSGAPLPDPVPEPSTLAFSTLAAAGLIAAARLRQSGRKGGAR